MKRAICLIACVMALAGVTRSSVPQEPSRINESTIVLTGTVTQLGATSFAEVPKSDRTMVVQVDQIIKKPPTVALKQGDKVTIQATDIEAFHQGMRATFYTDGWLFGSGIALKEIAHTREAPSADALERQIHPLRNDLEQTVTVTDQGLEDLLKRADAVIVGRVVDVHPWIPLNLAARKTHISEHDPDWHDAVIQVDDVIKDFAGTSGSRQLVVRFPASQDIAWYRAPKFVRGDNGTFFLHADQISGEPIAMVGGKHLKSFTALQKVDIQPAGLAVRVRALENRLR